MAAAQDSGEAGHPAETRGDGVVVLIPCLNEVATIQDVVRDFSRVLPQAELRVYDNGSSDGSAALAAAAGAVVRAVPRRGKGVVVQAMFAAARTEERRAWLLVDGDATYPAEAAPALLAPVLAGRADMVVGARARLEQGALGLKHRLGNRLFTGLIRARTGLALTDALSGYRALSPRLIAAVSLSRAGFEVETELNLEVARAGLRVEELPVAYRARPPGSRSKLNAARDGLRIAALLARRG